MKYFKILFSIILFITSFFCFQKHSCSQENNLKENILPVYLAELPNINDYNIFANGGWDGSWYIGLNVCWIEQLPPAPKQNFRKAFIGAKIGRAKTRPIQGKPVWEKEPIPGDIYIGISSTPSWSSTQSYYLTDSSEIPLEADYENATEGVGESRWFWREIPLEKISFENPNFLAVWSTSQYFVSTSSSPVLCGGWGSKKVNSWLNNDVKGYPPIKAENALKTPINVFEPAIAMKLIPEGTEQKIKVEIANISEGKTGSSNKTFYVYVTGNQIEKVWAEVMNDNKWTRYTRNIYTPPYTFTIKPETLPPGTVKIRVIASDIWENTGISPVIELMVTK